MHFSESSRHHHIPKLSFIFCCLSSAMACRVCFLPLCGSFSLAELHHLLQSHHLLAQVPSSATTGKSLGSEGVDEANDKPFEISPGDMSCTINVIEVMSFRKQTLWCFPDGSYLDRKNTSYSDSAKNATEDWNWGPQKMHICKMSFLLKRPFFQLLYVKQIRV